MNSPYNFDSKKVHELYFKYERLKDAVMALEPFSYDFHIDYDRAYASSACKHLNCGYGSRGHSPNCPVTKLRELLKDKEVSDVHSRAG